MYQFYAQLAIKQNDKYWLKMAMIQKGILVFLSFLFSITTIRAQNYPQNYFRNPLNIPMQLVANFGELRANHWHMGLDIRTQ